MNFAIGDKVGPYEIIEKFGQGGMATVYKAYHASLDRHVAIKVLHPAYKEDDSFLRRFTREAQVVARLEHHHIVPIYDFAEEGGDPYLVMRFIEGKTLKERMKEGPMPLDDILKIAQAIASGLDYAHAQGVLHRDIKPSNILLTADGGAYIADFGLARITQAGSSTMSQDMIMGTPQYISPEQAKGQSDLDARTDIYSFGIILYEMITGQVPFQADTGYSIIHSQIFDEPPRPSVINQQVGMDMEKVLLKALNKERDERYDTAMNLFAAFRQAAQEMPTKAIPAEGTAVVPAPTPAPSTLTAAPPLPDLSHAPSDSAAMPTPAPTAAAPEATLTQAPAPQPPANKRTLFIGVGLIVGVLLVAALFLAAARRNQREQAAATATAVFAATEAANTQLTAIAQAIETALPQEEPDGGPPNRLSFDFIPNEGRVRPIEELEPLYQADPQNRPLAAELAAAYIQADQREEARQIIQQTFAQLRQPGGYAFVLDHLLTTEHENLALIVAQEGLNQFPGDPEIQHMAIFTAMVVQVPPETMAALLEQISQYRHNEALAAMATAYIQLQESDVEGALSSLEGVEENSPPELAANVLFLQGQLYLRQGEADLAHDAFADALDYRPPPWLSFHAQRALDSIE